MTHTPHGRTPAVRLAQPGDEVAVPAQSTRSRPDSLADEAGGAIPLTAAEHRRASPAVDNLAVTAPAEPRVRIGLTSGDGSATFGAAAAAALGLVWVLYEKVLPFSGVLGFWVTWYVVFIGLYLVMARLQWDRLEARNRLASVVLGTWGVVAFLIVVEQVAYVFVRGSSAVAHSNFWSQSLAFAGPDKKTLYVVGRGVAFKVAMLTEGFKGRAK